MSAFIDWLVSKTSGIDPTAEQSRSNALDAQLNQLYQDNSNLYSSDYQTTAQADIAASDQQFGTSDGGVSSEFTAGWNDAENSLTRKVKGVFNSVAEGTAGFIFKSVPWYYWVIGAIILFVYFGGLRLIPKSK